MLQMKDDSLLGQLIPPFNQLQLQSHRSLWCTFCSPSYLQVIDAVGSGGGNLRTSSKTVRAAGAWRS